MKDKWIKRQQEILDAARAAGRDLTAEEKAEWDALQRKIDGKEGGDTPQGGGEPTDGQRSAGGQAPVNTPAPAPAVVTGAEDAQRAVAEERQRINDIMAGTISAPVRWTPCLCGPGCPWNTLRRARTSSGE